MNTPEIKHSIIALLLGISLCVLSNCQSSPKSYSELPEHYQQQGLVTSNTYQIHITVSAESMQEATKVATPKARSKMYNLIIKEPSLHFSISTYGRKKIKDLIQHKGAVVYAIPQSEESWIVVFQVYKKGLWNYLRKIY